MEIKIGKSARRCVQCDTAFEHDQDLKSLVRLAKGALEREDFCVLCWAAGETQGAFSVWSSRFCDPNVAAQEPPEAFSPLRQTFYEAAEAQDRTEMAKAYLAAQLLRRQKVFRRIKESTDPDSEARIALFSDRIGNTLVEVHDPNLTYEELEQGRHALMKRLSELENDDPEDAAAVVAEEDAVEALSEALGGGGGLLHARPAAGAYRQGRRNHAAIVTAPRGDAREAIARRRSGGTPGRRYPASPPRPGRRDPGLSPAHHVAYGRLASRTQFPLRD